MKKINFIVIILLLTFSCFAQNKKEQIATLNIKVDSLILIINNQNIKLDLLSQNITKIEEDVSKLNNTLSNNTKKVEELETQIANNKIDINKNNEFINQIKEVFWYKPTEDNIKGEWTYFRDEHKINDGPYFVSGDFDNNGIKDEAWILINHTETKMRFCIYMNYSVDYIVIQEFDFNYSYYIEKAKAGTYETWCKKHNECKNGELTEFTVENSAIYFGFSEVGYSAYVWQNSKFVSFTISD